jgi:replicative DNA helicase
MNQREPFSQEAEQAVLGAMLIKPELIDILSADLKESDFFFAANRAVFGSIMDLRGKGLPVDFLTVGENIGALHDGSPAFAYTAELHHNTPSAANAKSYAGTVVERSIDRALVAACYNINEIASSDSNTEDKIAMAQAEINSISSGSGEVETITAKQAIEKHVDELERRESLGGQIDGLTTGIESLDAKLMGLKPEALIVIAGRPKMGKTTLAMNIADHNAVQCSKQVLVFSLEMSNQQLMDKSLSSIGSIPLQALKDGSAMSSHSNELLAASSKIAGSGLALYDRKGATINRIRSVSRRHKLKHGLDLILVDHIGLVDVEDSRANAVQRISEITRQLKLLAKELGVPVIALSQLNRQLEARPNKRPIPSDLRDSGSIEQDADLIMFVYRDEVYNENTEFRGVAEIIIGVARDIEACTQKVRYQGKYSLFSDLRSDYEAPAPRAPRSYSSSSLLD